MLDYLLQATPYNLEIAGLTNFVLRGESPEKVRLICGAYDAGCVRILDCANVTVRGLQNKFLKPTFCQGLVTAADQETGRVEIKLAEGSLPPTDPSWTNHYAVIRGSLYFPDGRIDPACPNVAYEFDAEDLGEERYAVFFSTRFTKKRYGKLTSGRVLAMPNRDNRYSAMAFSRSELCNFEDCAFANVRKGPAWIISLADSVFENVTLDGKPMPIPYFKSCQGNFVK